MKVITVNILSISTYYETLAATMAKPYIYHVELNRGTSIKYN